MLRFDQPKPLGKEGHRWMKIHLCNFIITTIIEFIFVISGNLFGNNKISFDDREAWTNQHLNDVYDSAINPLSGKRFWTKAEEPFQVWL